MGLIILMLVASFSRLCYHLPNTLCISLSTINALNVLICYIIDWSLYMQLIFYANLSLAV